MTADDKYFLLKWDNLTQPIPMQLSQKQKAFSEIFLAISKFALNFEHFQTKDDSHSWFVPELTNYEKRG